MTSNSCVPLEILLEIWAIPTKLRELPALFRSFLQSVEGTLRHSNEKTLVNLSGPKDTPLPDMLGSPGAPPTEKIHPEHQKMPLSGMFRALLKGSSSQG